MNVDKIANWLKINNLKIWRIVNDNKETMAKTGEEVQNLDDSIVLFFNNVETLPDGIYKVIARDKPTATNAELTNIFIKSSKINAVGNNYIPDNSIQSELINQLKHEVDLMKQKEKEREILEKYQKQLQEKDDVIKKLKDKISSPQTTALDKVINLIMVGMANQNKKTTPNVSQQNRQTSNINQVKPEPKKENEDFNDDNINNLDKAQQEQANIMQNSFEKISETLGNDQNEFLQFISNLGKVAEQDKDKFLLYNQMLKQQV